MQVADEHNTPRERTSAPFLLHGSTTCRVQQWSYRSDVAQLVLYLQRAIPTPHDLAQWCQHLTALGFRTVRTSAVNAAAAPVFEQAGFLVTQELALLEHTDVRGAAATMSAHDRTRRMSPRERQRVAAIDMAAFGEQWAMDDTALHDVCAATPRHRSRVAGDPFRAFAISGRDGRLGFLQRLGVHPDVQRQGLGWALVADSLAWMARWQVQRVLVNTPVDNDAALTLYHRAGYRRLPEVLRVYERGLA